MKTIISRVQSLGLLPSSDAQARAQRAELHLDLADTLLTELAVKTSHVEALMAAWRGADSRYGRIASCGWLVRLLLWPSCFTLAVMIVAGFSSPWGWAPLAFVGLAVAYSELLDWADLSVAKAWDALAKATGLGDEALVNLVQVAR